MADIKPFRGYHPKAEVAAQVASQPYDTLSVAEARPICAENPLSYLHVVKTQADFPEDASPDLGEVQQRGYENLSKFIDDGTLVQSETESFYLYRQSIGEHVQTGLVAGASAWDYEAGNIRKHERTLQAKEDMMAEHMDSLGADAGPVILIYPDEAEIDALVEEQTQQEPAFSFEDDTGVTNTLWCISDPQVVSRFIKLFAEIPILYIADGHHRGAGGWRIAESRKAKNPDHTGDESYNHFLTMIFPATQNRILDYNRCVKDLNEKTVDELLAAISEKFDVEKRDGINAEEARPTKRGEIAMRLDDCWYKLTAHVDIVPDDLAAALDVSLLQDNILAPILGIDDPRTSQRIDFVGGSRGLGELERRCDVDCKIAFALYPTSIQDLMQIANANDIMPPKSTWFDPKPLSGAIVRRF